MKVEMNKDKFIVTIQANQGIIRKVANSYCKNGLDRDDLIQEITIQLWRSWGSYNPQLKLSTWMYKVALNVAISFYRKTYKQSEFNKELYEDDFFLNQEQDGELEENIKALYFYISKLDELNKALILLYLDNCSHEEMADTLGITKTNVATKIARIKKQLKSMFQQKD